MPDVRLCFFGDSFTNGFGDPEGLGWAGRVCRAAMARDASLELTYYNLGVRRDTSRDVLARWEGEAALRLVQCAACRLVFSFGTNDTTHERGSLRVPLAESVRKCRSLLSDAQEHCPVVLIGPAPVVDPEQNDRIRELSSRYAELCGELQIPFLDVVTPLLAGEIWVAEAKLFDGAHPRAGGYAELASLVDGWEAWRAWFP